MSRTEGVHLPRLPTSHARVTSSRDIRPHVAAGSLRKQARRRSLTEPSYTAYVGTPRQDIPHPVFSDAAMYDDVFDKEGRLLSSRNSAKFTSPLNTVGYNSLNDPHCQKLFLNNRRLRSHLINLGLITDDLRVVATTREQRQKIRAHELLERKEMLAQKLECREQERLQRLSQPFHLPQSYQDSESRQEFRREQWGKVQEMKAKKIIKRQEQERAERTRRLEQKKAELAAAIEEVRLQEQTRRNAIRAQQEMAEIRAYEKAFGKNAHWHREADRINNRMVAMQLHWSKKTQHKIVSESFPPASQSRHSPLSCQDESKPSSKHQESLGGEMEDRGREETERRVVTPLQKTENMWERDGEGFVGEKEREGEGEGEKEREGEGEGEGEKEREGEGEGEGEKEREGEGEQAEIASKIEEPVSATGEKKRDESTGEEEWQNERELEEKSDTEERDESEIKEPPLPPLQSPPHTSQEAHSTAHVQQPQQYFAEGEQAKQELAQILIEAFYSIDGEQGTGYLSVDDFLQVLMSRDLGLQLEENEQLYIASQVDIDASGVVPYMNVAPLVPDLLFQIFAQRVEQNMQYYGYYMKEQWIQIYPVSGGVVYLNKLTGTMQTARPNDFRPYLKDEVFEDSVVDFFETADTDRDGLIDYKDFYNLLASPLVASRVYRRQMEQLLGLYQTHTAETEGTMDLALFSSVASSLLLMIYQNAYPDVEEWIELESKKFGPFWLNKNTGQTILPHQDNLGEKATPTLYAAGSDPASTEAGREGEDGREGDREKPKLKSRKKKKHKKKANSEEIGPPPPQLIPRPKSRPTSQQSIVKHASLDHDPASTTNDTQEDVKPVSSRSRLIGPVTFETIPEEDETVLEDSLKVINEDEQRGRKEVEYVRGDTTAIHVQMARDLGKEGTHGKFEDQNITTTEDDGNKEEITDATT